MLRSNSICNSFWRNNMYAWLEPTITQLCDRAQRHKLHHALLLQGAQGIGKTAAAQFLGRYLLCSRPQNNTPCNECQSCLLLAAGNHPDLYEIISDKQIGVDSIRESIRKLSGSSQLSGAKVLVIHAAHTMTESSANALLKTLEEPTKNTFLLLLTHKPERLLATIRSRCEKVVLPSPNVETCVNWLSAQGFTSVDPALLSMYVSSPLVLLERLNHPPKVTYQDFLEGIESLRQGNIGTAELAAKWQEHAETVVKWLQYWLSEQMKQQPQRPEMLWAMHQGAISASAQLANPGINKTLLLANVLQHLLT
ncbi:MAG: DNA polymerase-3 subunit delta' [Paraglaciecola sp.]|jgi:DNA polymerase-3 subunit delta'